MKPVFATLRQLGHLSSNYIDGSCLIGPDKGACEHNVVDTVTFLDSYIHPEESVFIPTQKLGFWGSF